MRARAIGAAIRPPSLAEFLQINPMDRFDIQTLNVLRLGDLVRSAGEDFGLLSTLERQAEALMDRVKREVDDPLSAGAFLREQVLRWYRESPADPSWSQTMPDRWAGIFAESRVSGGKLEPWLNLRLWSLRGQAAQSGTLGHRLRRGVSRERRIEALVARTPAQQIRAEVAQAILDDLSAARRDPESPLPMVRLSELAVRRQVATVNEALALLFNAPEIGPFVILHPNRYPSCEEMLIRPPSGGATGAALAYSLGTAKSSRRPVPRGRGPPGPGSGPDEEDDAGDEGADEALDATSIWEADEVAPAAWRSIIRERRRERRRLDPPPKDYRTRPAYAALRQLLLEDSGIRPMFVATKWRGRPSGLPLLATLVMKGTLAPEVATDHEYLEAELGDLVQGDPQWKPTDGRWEAHGWLFTQEGSHQEGFRFVAKPSVRSKAESE